MCIFTIVKYRPIKIIRNRLYIKLTRKVQTRTRTHAHLYRNEMKHMFRSILLVLGLLTVIANAAGDIPTFPTQWWSDYASTVAIYQGGTYNSTSGEACCSLTSPGCKVQAEGQLGTQYTDGRNNQSAISAEGQTIISKYGTGENGKEYLVTPASSGKGWDCSSYCPLDESWFDPLEFDKTATDLGKVNIGGKSYDHWQWYDKIFKTITMDIQDWFVDESDPKKPIPYLNKEKLTPFGGPALGTSSQEFDNFEAGLDKFDFQINGLSSCEKNDNCGDDRRRRRRRRLVRKQQKSLSVEDEIDAFVNKKQRLSTKAKRHNNHGRRLTGAQMKMLQEYQKQPQHSQPSKLIVKSGKWPNDWSSETTNSLLVNQGGHLNKAGNAMCCTTSESGQCQVQAEFQSGMVYYDYTHQRQRMEDPVNGIVVGFFSTDGKTPGKNMQVEHNGTHDVCVKYCPIPPEESMDGGRDQFLDQNATNLGKVTYKGHEAIHWQWNQTIFGVITMEITDFYASPDDVPIAAIQKLTPFGGPAIGAFHNTWTNFKPGSQPAAKFDIHDADTCPQDPQCEEPEALLGNFHINALVNGRNKEQKMQSFLSIIGI